MDIITKLQPVWICMAALMGLAGGYVLDGGDEWAWLIEPFLMVLLFFVFLSVTGDRLQEALTNLRFTITACAVNFIWTPLVTFALGALFFADSLDLQMGLMMLMVTPCTDWYLVFTGLAGGNVTLGASILPLNLLLQVLLLPVYLVLFFGSTVAVSLSDTAISIAEVLCIPFGAAFLLKRYSRGHAGGKRVVLLLTRYGDTIQLLFLCLAVMVMFASESRAVIANPFLLAMMLIPLCLFFSINYVAVHYLGRFMNMTKDTRTALHFTTLARNSPLSLAIAVAAFPDRPLISLALVIGPLIELPALGIITQLIKRTD